MVISCLVHLLHVSIYISSCKGSYRIWMIFKLMNLTHRQDIWDQSEPRSNGNDGVFHIPQRFSGGTYHRMQSRIVPPFCIIIPAHWVESSPMVLETWVQSQVASYQRFKKKMVLDASLLNTRQYVSRVRWRNPWKGVVPSLTPRCSSYWKGSLLVALDYGRQVYFFTYIYIYI